MWVFIIAIVLFILYYFIFLRNKKSLKYGDMVLFSGGIKVGKTTLSVYTLESEYASRLNWWKKKCKWITFFNNFRKNKKELPEMPLLYSTMPLNMPYVPITKELILRQKRYANKSIVYINEATFLASQFDYKDEFINTCLTFHNKLIGHELKGGLLIIDTQSVKDLHFAFKNCLSNYIWIHHKKNFFFFWIKMYVRELIYQDGQNDFNGDVENDLVEIIVPKRVWKLFDCYAYSSLTDNLEVEDNVVVPETKEDLKIKSILRLKDIYKGGKK